MRKLHASQQKRLNVEQNPPIRKIARPKSVETQHQLDSGYRRQHQLRHPNSVGFVTVADIRRETATKRVDETTGLTRTATVTGGRVRTHACRTRTRKEKSTQG